MILALDDPYDAILTYQRSEYIRLIKSEKLYTVWAFMALNDHFGHTSFYQKFVSS